MFNLFKSQESLVKEIHNEFDVASEKLLKEAKSIISNRGGKSGRLKTLGFINAKGVEQNNAADLAEYYSNEYPFLKFITEKQLDDICKKYGLTYMPIENYIGDVPEKNLCEIESTQQRKKEDAPEDKIWCELKRDNTFSLFCGSGGSWSGIWGSEWYRVPKKIEGRHFNSQYNADDYLRDELGFTSTYLVSRVRNFTQTRQGLFICAPPSQFKGKNKSIFFTEVKDPIVFRYCRGGVQVLSKWGLEAEDKDLVNEKMN